MSSTTALIGYAQPWIAQPEQRIEFKISSNGPMQCDLVILRIICADIDPSGPGEEFETMAWGSVEALQVVYQEISAGSCGKTTRSPVADEADGLILSIKIFPTLGADEDQVIFACGQVELTITPDGQLNARAGEANAMSEEPLELHEWYNVQLRLHNGDVALNVEWVHPRPDIAACQTASAKYTAIAWPDAETPLILAAGVSDTVDDRSGTRNHFNGKIEAPQLCDASGTVMAAWNFSRDQSGASVADTSGNGFDLDLINTPMRGATGHLWNGSADHWELNPDHYGAIHFHDDDITDCQWTTSNAVTVPADARSGFYIARLTADGVQSDISFFVSAKTGKPTARILFLVPTATYLAYANTHIKFDSPNTENLYEAPMALSEDELYLNEHRELGLSLYDTHSDDSGVAYAGTRRPMLNNRPGLYTFNYVNDTHIVKWLEDKNYPYDIATDDDLHYNGIGLLEPYDVVITGSHPEYYSTAMWDALDGYQNAGGRHMYLGGNGFYWRIAWSDQHPEVIENRRGISGVRTWEGEPGEHTLSFSGEPGGLWRQNGRAPQRLVGNGFSSTLFVRSTHFKPVSNSQTEQFDFVFNGVAEETIGDFGYRGGGCVGLEIDRWDADLGSPANSVILAKSAEIDAGGLLSGEEYITTTRALDGTQNANVRADMVIFATNGGGAVWSTGSIAWATSLLWNGGDNNVSKVTQNVLDRFLDPAPIA